MKSLRSILPFLNGKWKYVVIYALSNLLSVIFSTLTVGMISPFLNMLFDKGQVITQNPGWVWSKEGVSQYFLYQLSSFMAAHGNDKTYGLIFICLVVIFSTLLKNLFLYIAKYMLHPLRNNIVLNIRKQLYDKVLHLPIGFFTNERKGDILSRMTNDVNAIEISIISMMELLFSTPVTVIFYFVILLLISAKLFLFLLFLLPIAGLIIGRISKSLKRNTINTQERLGNILSMIEETLGGLRIIKAFRAERRRSEVFQQESQQIFELNNRIAARRELASPMSEFLGILILSIIIWFGGNMALKQPAEIEPGLFIMFISLFYFLINPLKALSQIFYNIHQGSASLERIQLILNADNQIVDRPDARALNSFEHQIEFKHVSFAYGDKVILKNIDLTIEKGKTLAIVGASGAGKSTLVDLIPRFHDTTSGDILIDGISIRDYRLSDVRALMGVVSQEPILFNDSIAENIALGSNKASESAVDAAAGIANARSFILEKEDGYATNIGDRGNKLSGGEKQRLTIARAIFKNPPVLILDEATSSLDTVSERQVQDAIQHLMENRTSIVIAHRLSTVQHADEIIVMEAGEIKERGTHQSLMQLGGLYKRLVEIQQEIK
jgi:subfamily B ATP-binding cassette protein MsbA